MIWKHTYEIDFVEIGCSWKPINFFRFGNWFLVPATNIKNQVFLKRKPKIDYLYICVKEQTHKTECVYVFQNKLEKLSVWFKFYACVCVDE